MNLELFIAEKIHFSKEGDREVTPPAVRIAMIGIALGLAVMILSVAIVIGFKKEVRNKVIGFVTWRLLKISCARNLQRSRK